MSKLIWVMAMVAASVRPCGAAEEEPSREWYSKSEKLLAAGVFWRAEKGVVEIKTSTADEPVKIEFSDLSAEDVKYMLRNDGGVMHPTTQLLLNGYVMDKNKTIVPLSKHLKKFSGTVQSKIGDDMMVVGDLEVKAVLSCDATEYKKGSRFAGWVYPLKETLTLSDGRTSRIYRAYTALGNPKQIAKLIQTSPLKVAKYVTGSSNSYRAWVNTQEKLRRTIAAEKRQTELVKARTEARTTEVEKRTQARLDEQQTKQAEQLKRKIADTEGKIKTLESNIKTWESRKRSSKMHSKTYNRMRKNIGDAERQVVLLKKDLREYKASLKTLTE